MKRSTTDALEILDDLFIRGRPEMEAMLEEAHEQLRLAECLRDWREKAGLTQREVAGLAGTTRSVISRLEQPGYNKHTLTTLRRVAAALGCEVRVQIVPRGKRSGKSASAASKRAAAPRQSSGRRAGKAARAKA
ncbi:helix-turn-helix transcriptional regulator [Candidatus Poribacteria bacterium]|nr:helix-turn-helix transcriptional regulator [Candidatus Poribacteria bacterium]